MVLEWAFGRMEIQSLHPQGDTGECFSAEQPVLQHVHLSHVLKQLWRLPPFSHLSGPHLKPCTARQEKGRSQPPLTLPGPSPTWTFRTFATLQKKKIIMQKHHLGEKLFTYLFSLSVTFLLPTPPRRTRPRRLSLCHLQAVPGPDAAGTPGPSPSGAAAPDPAPAAGPAAPQLGQRTADPLLPSAACPAH